MLSRALGPFRPAGVAVRTLTNTELPRGPARTGRAVIPEGGEDPPKYRIQARHPNWPEKVKIVEVGPRDGLQNESIFVRTDDKLKFINMLVDAGLKHIEATSFVSARAVPQLQDAETLMRELPDAPDVTFPVLVPNQKQFVRALESGAKEIAIFTSPSERFLRANMRATGEEVNDAYKQLVTEAQAKGIPVRGYLSCAITCPYVGFMDPDDVARLAEAMIEWGCYEVSLGDTTGAGTPGSTRSMLYSVLQRIPVEQVALHCHDSYGQALANILAGLEMGVTTFDSSAGGIGGCPYAPRSSGNVATEDLVFMLAGMQIHTGVDLMKLIAATKFMSRMVLNRKKSHSKVVEAFPLDETVTR
ncbi:hydroxymethylglutaryl-CoA lyase, mitochondrial-like [Sycon ciliatum]|uniref:hydroxymethylglutaryl-CoA lyase, mitochondrial-like n=1 Tax=Sycon ciliatum TaxID=27933 RepID=UPI0031F6AC7E